MDVSPQDQAFKENITQVMQTLPPFLRTYIEQQKYTAAATGLMAKYKLRIDQGGVLELNLLLLLMGINNPTEFTQALLTDAKIDQQTVNSIIEDVNNQIFVPLRKEEEMQSRGNAAPQQSRPVAPMPPRPMAQQAAAAPHIAPLPPKTAMPTSATLGDIVRSVTSRPAETPKMLKDHEESHIEFSAPEIPRPVTPAPRIFSPVPENLPGMMPLVEKPAVTPITPPALPKIPPPPSITSYSSDPYREPIEGDN